MQLKVGRVFQSPQTQGLNVRGLLNLGESNEKSLFHGWLKELLFCILCVQVSSMKGVPVLVQERDWLGISLGS